MDFIHDQYEPEMLSLFGGETLLTGLGSPLEPDSPTSFPIDGASNQLGLLGLAHFDDKLKTPGDAVTTISSPQGGSSGLEWSWMDTRLDLFDWVDDEKSQPPTTSMAIDSPVSIDTTSMAVAEPITAQDLFNQIADNAVSVQPTEQDMLSDVLNKLSDYISNDDVDASDIPNLGNGVLSPVSVDDIESLLSDSDRYNDSGLESLLSPSTSGLNSRSESPTPGLDFMHDPDYMPQPEVKVTKSSKSKSRKSHKSTAAPYCVPLDKKERKKLQNKNAALKYRQKKKEESGQVGSELGMLETRNKELKDKAESLTREIQYLKDLMGEVLKAKGVKL